MSSSWIKILAFCGSERFHRFSSWMWRLRKLQPNTQNGDSDLLPNHPNRSMAWCISSFSWSRPWQEPSRAMMFLSEHKACVFWFHWCHSRILFCASCSSPMATITSPIRISGWPGHSSSSSTKYPACGANFQLHNLQTTQRARQKSKVLLASQAESWSPAPACWSTRSFAVRTGPLRNNHFFQLSSILAPLLWSWNKSKGRDYRLLRPLPISMKIKRIWGKDLQNHFPCLVL